jgi:hypothetical protein
VGGYDGPLVLPTGRRVRVAAAPLEAPLADDAWGGEPLFAGRFLAAIHGGALRLGEGGRPLGVEEVLDWPLRDLHALRDVAERLWVIATDHRAYDCRNCGAAIHASTAPMDDLDVWYADDGAPPAPPFPLPAAAPLASGAEAHTVEVVPVTGREALPLWRALASEADRPLTAPVVRGLGVRALGDETDPAAIAASLDRADDGTWDALEAAFIALNYADRAFVPQVCARCGTVHDLPAPSAREVEPPPAAFRALHADDERAPGAPPSTFPDEEAFAAMVERLGEEVYVQRGVQHIALHTDLEVPPVDGSGEPLMGSYQPIYRSDAVGYTDVSFEIRLYYRTFRNIWHQDGPYDVEAEVRETIDHEVEHHLHHLAGHDPMDEEERDQARRDLERTFGVRAVRRAERAALLGELRRIGILFAVLAVVFGVMVGALYALGILQD